MSTTRDGQTLRRRRALALPAILVLALGACDRTAAGPTEAPGMGVPDYAIGEVTHAAAGRLDDLATVTFKVRVRNLGENTRQGTSVAMYVDGRFAQQVPVPGLSRLEGTTVTFSWPARAGTHRFLFGVDRPPLDTTFVAESNEDNNTAGIVLEVPYGRRKVAAQETIRFADLPPAIIGDSLVRQVLGLLRESGHSVAPGARVIRTRYEGEGITTFHLPFAPLDAPAAAAPILTIVSRAEDGGVIFPYVFEVADGTGFVLYDSRGGVRASRPGGAIQLLGPETQGATCSEGLVWPCVLEVGPGPLAAHSEAIDQAIRDGSTSDLVKALVRDGSSIALPAYPTAQENLEDNPPSFSLTVIDERQCTRCHGSDLQVWWAWTYVFTAWDDHGEVVYLTDRVWVIPCNGGTHTFAAKDNADQVTTVNVTVTLPPDPVLTYPNHRDCHNQGGGS